jgi:hypothetical protein
MGQMKWQLRVPKIFHVYWGGGVMPYIRFLTVKSFMKYNPDWKIMFWYPKYPTTHITWPTGELCYPVNCDDYSSEMLKLPIKSMAVDFDEIGFKNTATEVHKSDFIRLHLLTTFGGVWSDMDIIYFKPITNLLVNTIENRNKETFVCSSAYGHSIGFLMSQPKSKFFQYLLDIIKSRPLPSQYQAIGPTLYNEYFRNIETINQLSPAINLDMDVVYSHNAGSIPDFLNNVPPRFTEGSIGAHWYAGHSQWSEFFARTNGGLTNLPNNLIGNIIRKINNE